MIEKIAPNLKFLRLQRKWNIIELASYLSISKSAISDYENGKTIPTITVILQYCKLFNVTINNLIKYKFSAEKYVNKEYKFDHNYNQIKEWKSREIMLQQRIEVLEIQSKLQGNLIESKTSEIQSLKIQIQLMQLEKGK